MSLFSYLILKKKLYKHHYLSIGVIFIIGIIDNFSRELFTIDSIKQNFLGYIMILFAESINVIQFVLLKFLMLKKFIKSYEILFFQGLIELILGIISLVLATKYFNSFDNYETYFRGLDSSELVRFFSLILLNFLSYLTMYIIIDIFMPFHIFLLNIFSDTIMLFFHRDFWHEKIYIIVLYFIFLIILIFMTLVFIEIIQLNFCGLSTMTKKNIEERARLDSLINNEQNDEEDENDNINNYQDKEKNENRISYSGYNIELKNLNNNDKINQILPSEDDSINIL